MAIKTVKNFYDALKGTWDWASGVASGIPKVLLYGSDDGGTNKRLLKTGADGTLGVSLSATIPVLSTDNKPTMTSAYRGHCFETDTLKLFSWSSTAWVEVVL